MINSFINLTLKNSSEFMAVCDSVHEIIIPENIKEGERGAIVAFINTGADPEPYKSGYSDSYRYEFFVLGTKAENVERCALQLRNTLERAINTTQNNIKLRSLIFRNSVQDFDERNHTIGYGLTFDFII